MNYYYLWCKFICDVFVIQAKIRNDRISCTLFFNHKIYFMIYKNILYKEKGKQIMNYKYHINI